jgi:hypothetical protein
MAHTRKTVVGLKGLYISDINGTGLISEADWEVLAVNLEGTFNITQDDTEQTDINIEESDSPIIQVLKAGAKSFDTSIPDLAYEVANRLFGATKSTETVEGVALTRVKIPDSAAYIYKMFKIVPSQGVEQFYVAKGQISAKINGPLSKTETLNIDLSVTALEPDNDTETALSYDIADGTNAGYLLGDTLSASALTTLQAVNAGGLTLTVDGGAAQDVNSLDFTSATDWDDVVAVLNGAFTGATWSMDVDEFRMKVTSNTTGSSSTIVLADGSTGTQIRGVTMLNMSASTPVAGS